jgi:hypothetical protein
MPGEGFVTTGKFGIFSRNLNRRLTSLESGGAIAIPPPPPSAVVHDLVGSLHAATGGDANYIPGVNAAATTLEYKQLLGTSNQVSVAHAACSITWSLPQNIHAGASPEFAGLTLTSFSGVLKATAGVVSGGGAFLHLADVPASYDGMAAKHVRVNLAEDALEFANYAQVVTVAKSGGDFTTIQAAINSVTDAEVDKRYLVRVMPGVYAEQVTMKSWVDLRGVGKHCTEIEYASSSGAIILADSVQIEDILIEGTATATDWAIVGTNASNVHIRWVDILNPFGSNNRSQGIKNTGNTWSCFFIEHMVINLYTQTGHGIYLTGNGQNIDTTINDVFLDTYSATNGGGIYLSGVLDIQIRNSILRTSTAGYDLHVAGNSNVGLYHVFMDGDGCSLEIEVGSTVRAEYVSAPSYQNAGTLIGIIGWQGNYEITDYLTALNVNLTELNSGYLPYRTAWAFGDSPFITDGTSVGLGIAVYDALFNVLGADYPVAKFIRSTAGILNDSRSTICLQHRTTGDMIDGFGTTFAFEIRDSAGVNNVIANISAVRQGADNSGKISFDVYNAGVQNKGAVTIDKTGILYTGFLTVGTSAGILKGTAGVVSAVSLVQGDVIYASAANTPAGLADVAVGSYLRSGGVSAAPLWSTLKLPNAATAFRLPVATGANTIGELVASGATGEYLAGVTGAIPAWATLNQAAIPELTTASGPTFAHLHLTDGPATGGALITAAESWIGPSAAAGIYFKGGKIGKGTATPAAHLEVSGSATEIRVTDTGINWAGYSMSTGGGISYFVVDNAAGNAFGSGSAYSLVLFTGYVGDIVFMPQGVDVLRFKGDTFNIGFNQSTFGTSLAKGIGVGLGTAPTTFPVNCFQMAAIDIAPGEAAPHFWTEHGDLIKLYQQAHIADATNATDVITRANAILAALENIGFLATA